MMPSDDTTRFTPLEVEAMHEALTLAARARGDVEPNPLVGAVLLQEGEIVARGWHETFGGVHAEVACLHAARKAGIDSAGLTMMVTLEPCVHHGKQPPCVDAVLDAKLKRVVIAMQDPFEQVAGRGIAKLREAGVEVAVGLCEAEARELNRGFVKRIATGLPWVTLKWAQTLDGKTATRTGDSQWISNASSRKRVHLWRSQSDAIIVGIGTARADDPQLTARDVPIHRETLRVVVDRAAELPVNAKLLANPGPPVIVAVRDDYAKEAATAARVQTLRDAGAIIWPTPMLDTGRLDLAVVLRQLVREHDATHVLVEGGSALHGSLLQQGQADALCVFIAPRILGDAQGLDAIVGHDTVAMPDAAHLKLHRIEQMDGDILAEYRKGT